MKTALFTDEKIVPSKETEIDALAQIEQMLETYVYKHKEKIIDFEKELWNIRKDDFDFNKKEVLLVEIKTLEAKFLAYYIYGRNLVTEEWLQELYKVKFKILLLR